MKFPGVFLYMRKTILLLLSGLLSVLPSFGAEADRRVSRVDESDGLSDNTVNAVLRDSRGFLWIGTNGGLDFYDGCNFVKVSFERGDGAGRPVVFSLAEAPDGTVWAGTSEGLAYLDKDGEGMKYHPAFDSSSIRKMCCDDGGWLWIAFRGSKVARLNTATGEKSYLDVVCPAVCRGVDGAVYALSEDGQVLVSPDGGPDLDVLISEGLLPGLSRIFSSGQYLFLVSDSDATQVCDIHTKEIRPLHYINRLRDVLQGPDGQFVLAARDGIYYADSTLALSNILRPFHDNSFRCLSTDGRDGFWAGTLFEGLAQVTPDRLQFRHVTAASSAVSFKARDFVETSDGRVWAGTDTRGLVCVNSSGGPGVFFPGRNVTGLFPEGDNLWVGTIDNELPVALLETATGKISYFPEAGKSAYAFCRDRDGRLWIGGKDGFLVGKEGPGGTFGKDLFIPTSQVCRILLSRDGSMWVACISGMIFRYAGSAFSSYQIHVPNILTDIAEDALGRIFATTEGGGLWEYRESSNDFVACREAESRLFKMAADPAGKLLWITGAHGIHIINPDDQRALPVIPREVLEVDGFNYSSCFIASDGTLYAGTSDGYVSFSTRQLKEPSGISAPVISAFRILSSSGEGDGKCFLFPSSVNLGRNSRSFQVNVSTLDYSSFPSGKIFWKIEGRGDWTPVQDGSFTVYDIPSGESSLPLRQ